MFRRIAGYALLAAVAAGCRGGPTAAGVRPTATPAAITTVAAPAACSPVLAHAPGDTNETIESAGLSRTYILHVPAGYDGTSPTPVVLLFHGYSLNAAFMSAYAKFPALADAHGFIALIPDGSGSPQFWNSAGSPDGPDDVGFVRDLLAATQSQLCIDKSRVYAAGYSNGGGMAQFAACRLPGQIAAVGVVASTYGGCEPDVPVIAFHGTADPLLAFEGSSQPLGVVGGNVPAVRQALSAWAVRLGCDGLPLISRAARDVELSTFRHCRDGDGEALLYAVLGGGHTWPGGAFPLDIVGPTTQEVDASALIWQFFAAHPLRP